MRHNKKHIKAIQIFVALIILFNTLVVTADLETLKEGLPINGDVDEKPQYIQGEYIVKYKKNISEYEKINIYSQDKIDVLESVEEINTDRIKISGKILLKNKIRKLESNPDIEYIEPNYLYYPMEISEGKSRFGELWGLENIGQNIRGTIGTPNIDIDLLNAWESTQGREDVIVAVIDTGVDTAHPNLRDNIWVNLDEEINGKDSDNNGYVDDIHGWDFLNDRNSVFDPYDGDHHGTHIAGIIAASANEMGVVGVAPNIKIMPLKFLGSNEYGETVGNLSDALKAIEYAKNKGVKIVNASWGNYEHSEILEDAIEESGMLFLTASGNEGLNTDIKPSYPANFDLPNIISVGAVNNKGEYADFSNYGRSSVHVAAPGRDILSTIPLSRYKSAAVYSEGENYRSLFQAFGLETLLNLNDRMNIMEKSLKILEVGEEESILLVQDDESNIPTYKDSLKYYKESLDELGFTNVNLHKAGQHRDGPNFDEMKNYDLVIWFTGEGYGALNASTTAITDKDQDNLIKYLENGGKLYLSGRDAGENIEKTRFVRDYLNVEFKSEIDEKVGLWKNIIIGEPGTKFEQQTYNSHNTKYADIISPLNSGKSVMVYGSSNTFHNSYMYSGGTSMATPYVSGIAALLYSLGEEDTLSIKSLIMRGTSHIESIEERVLTGGMVNATRSINKYLKSEVDYVRGIDLLDHNIELDMKVHKEYTLKPNIQPVDANDKRVKWISSNEDIVVVDSQGKVKALKEGEATITAITLDGGYRDKCHIVVKDYEYPTKILDIKTYDINGKEKEYYEKGEKVIVKLAILSNMDKDATIILQTKDFNKRPFNTLYKDINLLEGKEQYIEFEFYSKEASQYIEVYLWDNLDNMKPLADKKIIKINNK